MDLGIIGIIDIFLILFFIITMIIGYKQGFMKKLLSFVGIISILIFSIMYCGQFAKLLINNDIIYPNIYENICGNITEYMADKGITEFTVNEILNKALNIPSIFADMIAKGIGVADGMDVTDVVATYLSTAVMRIIAFFMIFLGLLIVLGLLKFIANVLRTSVVVKVADGILGIVFYSAIYLATVCVLFYLLSLVIDQSWFSSVREFLEVDMQLSTEEFRISKFIYESNVIAAILNILI